MNRKFMIGALILAIVIFPFMVIQFTLAKSETAGETPKHIFKAKIQEKLDETETVTAIYQYYLVEQLEGGPDTEFVVLITSPQTQWGRYTQVPSNMEIEINQEFWGHGWLMDPSSPGEEYLFFDRPQVYLWQIKGTVLWPDQITELKFFYLAPITHLMAPILVVVFPLTDDFTLSHFIAIIVQTIVLVATIVMLIKHRQDKENLVLIVLGYILLTLIILTPVLPNPYGHSFARYWPPFRQNLLGVH